MTSGWRPAWSCSNGEGADQAAGRAQHRAPQPPDGRDRQGLHVRGPGRRRRPPRPLRGPPAADHLPLHVRSRPGTRAARAAPPAPTSCRPASSSTSTPVTRPTPWCRERHSRSSSGGRPSKGWDIPWYSSFGTDFNYDFGVTIDESVAPDEYNYRTQGRVRGPGRTFDSDSPSRCPAGAASSRSTGACSTPTRSTPVASSRPAAPTTSSTSPPSAARRTGRSRRGVATPFARPCRTSPPDAPPTRRRRLASGRAPGRSRGAS